ncbi:bifunctional DNA-formamidopyrimidine glycosylase/DNA-(apurinic or apyrimidinic site) lyase [Pediococcus ethanolidurans]|uniref:bifunctional DNA-formamidopyrimidine glycosylase/DNA-(apurinic or apyrimidinic site) lyase n=1 Tax=Pediococcus ethanolidurans TaxID=319653 RepID=UPI001C1ED9A2|nr:bifunctional DNA-formamidopyrimidine glycosylase/DNA-(apurinic or apyrimidinic site) lyase [Pediococcus ethanolidurans]MBU7554796.1 bifunctional DNA-formamidopyrimidine glycosylase/DNA-(apurinic or apyrimidinic site) lyase [Pediococcus ethanolidurans]MBU7562724.1 bifunctional DNA-formamidopyrimidine glycosylase/DNA-(apurinic or apyrimidinic site) lyase [Pediococcus ethanolidurans]MCT4397512.1 bifunctional DNA-formamidopyrimidine glycosylase/DNA-(apurinic or apyrimidinic site) lyase [Pediococc
MPELPEVETVKRGLTALVTGKKIKKIDVYYPKMVLPNETEFVKQLTNRTIQKIERRGKYLIFHFDQNVSMVSHLRMEGKYSVHSHEMPLNKHDHVVFEFTDGTELRYNDTRKFGRMVVVPTGEEYSVAGLKTIGPEPTPATLSLDYLTTTMKKHHKAIKSFLLDQNMIAGLGNIYCDEVLWLAKIHPLQPTNTVPVDKIAILRQKIFDELDLAIRAKGTTVFSYLDASGHAGSFQNQLHVYQRTGQPCERCGTPIERIKVSQRGTHFCPFCQKLVEVDD